jgi:hypothetical protein
MKPDYDAIESKTDDLRNAMQDLHDNGPNDHDYDLCVSIVKNINRMIESLMLCSPD